MLKLRPLGMDNLTHGLLGLSIAALRRRRPGDDPAAASRAQRATLLACLLAAELPDLDALWPAPNPVLHALQAHRGISHALLLAPLWAALATAVSRLLYREERTAPLFGYALGAVVIAHLVADAWTGWGTRLLLPFSDARVTWDWMVVVDPVFTLPLLLGALFALWQRRWWRPALLLGCSVSGLYLGTRIVVREVLTAQVEARYPAAEQVSVFPGWIGLSRWRFVASEAGHFRAGEVGLDGPTEQAKVPRPALSPGLEEPTVRAALQWARFPVLTEERRPDGSSTLKVGDLRYHLGGAPTLQFVLERSASGGVTAAHLDRGGTARELLSRWRRGH